MVKLYLATWYGTSCKALMSWRFSGDIEEFQGLIRRQNNYNCLFTPLFEHTCHAIVQGSPCKHLWDFTLASWCTTKACSYTPCLVLKVINLGRACDLFFLFLSYTLPKYPTSLECIIHPTFFYDVFRSIFSCFVIMKYYVMHFHSHLSYTNCSITFAKSIPLALNPPHFCRVN